MLAAALRLEEAERLARVGNWEWDIVKNEIHRSEELFGLFGRTRENFDVSFDGFLAMLHEGDREAVRSLVVAALEGRRPFEAAYRVIRPDGSMAHLYSKAEVTFDKDGKPRRLMGIIQDITVQTETEIALRQSEASERELRESIVSVLELVNRLAVLDSMDDMLRMAVEDGRACLGLDRMGIALLDASGEYTVGTFGTDEEGRTRDERGVRLPLLDAYDERLLSDGRTRVARNEAVELRGRAGEAVGRGSHAFAGMWDGTRDVGFINVDNMLTGREITDTQCDLLSLFATSLGHLVVRHRTMAALRESEERLTGVIESLPVIVYSAETGANRPVFMRGDVQGILGRSAEEVRENPVGAVTYVEEDAVRVAQAYHEGLASGRPFELESRIRRASDGRIVWLHERIVPVLDESGRMIRRHGIIQDVTGRKHAEEERIELERQILQAQKLESLGILAGGIAHDFNNLLVGIIGNADLAMMETPNGSSVHTFLNSIVSSARRAADLARQMLAYSGQGRFVIERVNLNLLIEEMSGILSVSIPRNADVRRSLDPDLPPLEVDATQIRQVLMNLITNAAEALGESGGAIRIATSARHCDRAMLDQVSVASRAGVEEPLVEGCYVMLEVVDSGCGMSEGVRERMFDPFFSTKFTGRGLGMAAVLGIVRGHRGAIEVESEVGHGTTIRVFLPAAAEDTDTAAAAPLAPPASSGDVSWRGQGTVLVVDDDATVREVAAGMLKRLGFEVVLAVDGVEALERYREHGGAFACVLLDLAMPRMGGEETYRELHRLDPRLKVVLSSGFSEQEVARRFGDLGLAGFIQKPYQASVLRDVLRPLFEQG